MARAGAARHHRCRRRRSRARRRRLASSPAVTEVRDLYSTRSRARSDSSSRRTSTSRRASSPGRWPRASPSLIAARDRARRARPTRAAGSRPPRWACCARACMRRCALPTRRAATALYCPRHSCDEAKPVCINVHSKVLIVDDELLTVGSANLSDRSMAYDTECNIAIEADGDPRVRAVIAGVRARLARRASRRRARGRPAATTAKRVAARRDRPLTDPGRRYLDALEPKLDPTLDSVLPSHDVVDPAEPLDPEVLIADVLPRQRLRDSVQARVAARRGRGAGGRRPRARLAALPPVARRTPSPRSLVAGAAGALVHGRRRPLLGAFVVGGFVLLPADAAHRNHRGGVRAVGGDPPRPRRCARQRRGHLRHRPQAGAGAGCAASPDAASRSLAKRLERRGLLAVLIVRLLPMAPYSIVNVAAAGVTHRLARLSAGHHARSPAGNRADVGVRRPRARGAGGAVGADAIAALRAWCLRRSWRSAGAASQVRSSPCALTDPAPRPAATRAACHVEHPRRRRRRPQARPGAHPRACCASFAADVVALQEVSPACARGRRAPSRARDTRHARRAVAHASQARRRLRQRPAVALSLAAGDEHRLVGDVRASHAMRSTRASMSTGTSCASWRRTWDCKPSERRVQVQRILAAFEHAPLCPSVVMGDVNEWYLWGRPLRWLHRRFAVTHAPATFPARRPLLKLDRIWAHPAGALARARRASQRRSRRVASDHLPLVAELPGRDPLNGGGDCGPVSGSNSTARWPRARPARRSHCRRTAHASRLAARGCRRTPPSGRWASPSA